MNMVHMYIYIDILKDQHCCIYIYIHLLAYTYISVCIHIYIYVYLYIDMYTYMYVYTYMHVYIQLVASSIGSDGNVTVSSLTTSPAMEVRV